MNKFDAKKVQKRTLELCKEASEKEEYLTAPLTIYQRIRSEFTIAKTMDEVQEMGYDQELVELIYKETFK